MTTRWKLTIEYDGTDFCGWQKQNDCVTVQQVIEEAILSFSGEPASLFVAGRTDSGVHALAQVAHFDLEKEFEPHAISGAINYFVRPHRVSILKAERVAPDFHARFDAKARSYRYLIVNRHAPLALTASHAWHYPKPLDAQAMQSAAQLLLGKHDFSTFRASHCQANSPIRTLDQMDIMRQDDLIVLETSARSFLYHQVRNMVGTLAMVGSGQWSVQDFAEAFAAADRTKGGPTAPPDGLYFQSVLY